MQNSGKVQVWLLADPIVNEAVKKSLSEKQSQIDIQEHVKSLQKQITPEKLSSEHQEECKHDNNLDDLLNIKGQSSLETQSCTADTLFDTKLKKERTFSYAQVRECLIDINATEEDQGIDLRLDLDSKLVKNFYHSYREGWSYLLPSKLITSGQSQGARFLNSAEILNDADQKRVIVNLKNQSHIFSISA